ncbi:hypothetical protein STEG23_035941, partial [Scotinomys teguina]
FPPPPPKLLTFVLCPEDPPVLDLESLCEENFIVLLSVTSGPVYVYSEPPSYTYILQVLSMSIRNLLPTPTSRSKLCKYEPDINSIVFCYFSLCLYGMKSHVYTKRKNCFIKGEYGKSIRSSLTVD